MPGLPDPAVAAPSPSNVVAFPGSKRPRPPSASDEAADILQCALRLIARGEIGPAACLVFAAHDILQDLADSRRL